MSGTETSVDVLVVGGGMAGLTAAAYLARAGLKVLLCEKEKKTGGLVNSFEYKGFVFDGGIRAIENSGIVFPMLKQLGLEVEFVPGAVSIGIGRDAVRITSKDSLNVYEELLGRNFPDNRQDVARIVREIRKVMGYMEVLYGIDNPLFLDLKNNPGYVFRTILPWMLKYALTMPRVAKLHEPVDEYLAKFTSNRALVDIIAQHFFQKTPAYFALSYFSLYLDYRYPRGGTGVLAQALERFVSEHGGEVRTDTAIAGVDSGKGKATDNEGNAYRYRKLVWAADTRMLYRIVNLSSLTDGRTVTRIRARQQELAGKTGGDSVFTLYLMVSVDKAYFADVASAHFFYTPSAAGLSGANLSELQTGGPARFTADKTLLFAWLKRFVELNTFEISIPVLRDPSLAPAGKTGLIVSLLFDYSLVKYIKMMGWYDEFRRQISDWMIEVLDSSIYPGLKAAVFDSFTSTPLTIERVVGSSQGAITGWAFTNDPIPAVSKLPQIAKAVLTPLPDVYQAGQWTFSPAGLPVSILTGKLAADRVVGALAKGTED